MEIAITFVTAHTARATTDILKGAFSGRLIRRFGDLHWPARSPDLTVLDFFLWGFLKSRVYVNKPQTLEENIHPECENLSPEVQARFSWLDGVNSNGWSKRISEAELKFFIKKNYSKTNFCPTLYILIRYYFFLFRSNIMFLINYC